MLSNIKYIYTYFLNLCYYKCYICDIYIYNNINTCVYCNNICCTDCIDIVDTMTCSICINKISLNI